MVDAAAGKPGTNNPGTTQPGSAPKSKAEADAEELIAFRKKVLAAVKPELEAIDKKATAAKGGFDKHVEAYAKHRHDYEVARHGWVKIDTMLTTEGVEMLRPTYSNDWPRSAATMPAEHSKTTTKPK